MRRTSVLVILLMASAALASAQNLAYWNHSNATAPQENGKLTFSPGVGTQHFVQPSPGMPIKNFDNKIFLGRDLDTSIGIDACLYIRSYNFSPGSNPKLQDVTTCTPGNKVTTKQAGNIKFMPL